ncbi:NAD binding domain of 6-phosphogluconate dehydrogenase-domain-containing protein [Coniochaeta sp. 2T2.1]|nr:NAD binding domain of 6-phosphogluconate dehydrogenase-domain-containing protein [Coniochaeta sp. 2T2.1]
MAPRLFWIGIGVMGKGMTKNIVENANLDSPLILYNRTKQTAVEQSNKLPEGKSEVVDSVQDGVSKADIIFTCLSNDAAVESTVLDALKTSVKGKLIVDCSTIHPDTTEKLTKLVVDAGGEFVAAPVFGAQAMAEAGLLIGVLAGPEASVEKVRPYFKGVMARAEILMLDEPTRNATTLKVIGNTFILNMVEQLSEGHVLAEKTGLGTKHLHDFIAHMFGGPVAAYSSRMVSGDYYKRDPPAFAVDLARKDAGHAKSLAKAAGVTLHNVETGDNHLKIVKELRGEKGDLAGVYGAVRHEAGLPYENA